MSDHHAVISPKVKVEAMSLLPRETGLVNDNRATALVLLSEAQTAACAHGSRSTPTAIVMFSSGFSPNKHIALA